MDLQEEIEKCKQLFEQNFSTIYDQSQVNGRFRINSNHAEMLNVDLTRSFECINLLKVNKENPEDIAILISTFQDLLNFARKMERAINDPPPGFESPEFQGIREREEKGLQISMKYLHEELGNLESNLNKGQPEPKLAMEGRGLRRFVIFLFSNARELIIGVLILIIYGLLTKRI